MTQIQELKEKCNHNDFNNERVGTEEYDYKFYKKFKCQGCGEIWVNNKEMET